MFDCHLSVNDKRFAELALSHPRVRAEIVRYWEDLGMNYNAAGLATGLAGSVIVGDPKRQYDLRNLPQAANLFAWHNISKSPTNLSATPVATGAAPPASTIGGNDAGRAIWWKTSAGNLGVATYQVSFDDGGTYSAPLPTAASVNIGEGTNLLFPNVAYNGDELYKAKLRFWGSLGTDAGSDWNDSDVFASSGPIFSAWGFNNRLPSAVFLGSALSNRNTYHAPLNGLPKSWTMIDARKTRQLTGAGPSAALRAWAYSNSAQASKDFYSAYITGSTFTGTPNAFALQRDDDAASVQTAVCTTCPSMLSPALFTHISNGVNLKSYINGSPWWDDVSLPNGQPFAGGNIVLNQFTIGCNKFGASAATNFFDGQFNARAVYTVALSRSIQAVIECGMLGRPN